MASENKKGSVPAKPKKDAVPRPPKKGGIGGLLLVGFLLFISIAVVALLAVPSARAVVLAKVRVLFDAEFREAYFKKSPGARFWARDENTVGAFGEDVTLAIQNNIVAGFTQLEMRPAAYDIRYLPKDSIIDITATVPRGRPMEWIIWNIADAARGTPYDVDDCFCATPVRCVMTFRSSNPKHPGINVSMQQTGPFLSNTAKMAIFVENFGFEADNTTIEYLAFPEPLTVSLIPAQRLAEWTAQIAGEYKKEVVLLLPMEPLPQQFSEYRRSMITVHQSEEAIRSAIAQAAVAIPNFAGISNLHGSRIMEDSRAMGIILSEVGRRNVYFVYTDSRRTVVPRLASEMGVPVRQFQGSIDADQTAEQVRERLRRFAMAAERAGHILIRTPPTLVFIQVLKDELEMLKRHGIQLVYVSELM